MDIETLKSIGIMFLGRQGEIPPARTDHMAYALRPWHSDLVTSSIL